jgi:hypothetical protein
MAWEHWYAWGGLMDTYYTHRPEDYPMTNTEEQNAAIYLNKIGYMLDSEDSWNANAPVTDVYGIVKSDHITEFTGSVGLYLNLPLSSHFALGTKALIGRSITQELDIDGHAEGNRKDISYTMTLDNRPNMQQGGDPILTIDHLEYPNNTGEKWTDDWEYLTVGAESSTSF